MSRYHEHSTAFQGFTKLVTTKNSWVVHRAFSWVGLHLDKREEQFFTGWRANGIACAGRPSVPSCCFSHTTIHSCFNTIDGGAVFIAGLLEGGLVPTATIHMIIAGLLRFRLEDGR